MHQNAEIARGEFHLLALLEITVRREPQPQVGDGRRVVVQNDVQRSFRRPLLLGFGCGRDAKLEGLARLAGRITARRAAEPCDVAVVSETLQQQRPDVGAPLRLRDEDAEHLDGARQRHVEQVDIVDVRVDQLAVVGFRKERFAHRPLVAHRKFAERRQRRGLRLFGVRCGPYDIVGAAARLGVERPVAVGDQHHLLFESFGLVDGHDLDRRFALVDAERACGPLLLPPVEEERNVGHAPRREADDLFVNGLQIGRFAASAVEPVAHDQFLESLFGRQQADRAQEIGLLRRQLRVERPSQVAVVDGFANRILLFDR